jgi:hypothetical protein
MGKRQHLEIIPLPLIPLPVPGLPKNKKAVRKMESEKLAAFIFLPPFFCLGVSDGFDFGSPPWAFCACCRPFPSPHV